MTPDAVYSLVCRLLQPPEAVSSAALAQADWTAVVATARAQGVAPLLAYQLGRRGWPAEVPAGARLALEQDTFTAAAHSLLIYQALTQIAQATARPVVVLKGAALAATLYPDPALRPLNDLDVLVPQPAVAPLVAALCAGGYAPFFPELSPGLDEALSHHHHLRGGPSGQINLEIHWSLVAGAGDWRAPDMAWFWAHTLPWAGPAEGPRFTPPLSQLDPTASLLHLAAHLMLQHGAAHARLIWYYDMLRVLQVHAAQIDWDDLARQAHLRNWAPAVAAALRGVQARFEAPVPTGLIERLEADPVPQAARLVARKAGPVQTRLAQFFYAASSLSAPARLRFALGVIVPAPAYVRWRYQPRPAWLWPLFYPVRWLDGLAEVARTLWATRAAGHARRKAP